MKIEEAAIHLRTLAKQASAIIAAEDAIEAVLASEGRVRAAEAAIAKAGKERDVIVAESKLAIKARDEAIAGAKDLVQKMNADAAAVIAKAKDNADRIIADATKQAAEKASILADKIEDMEDVIEAKTVLIARANEELESAEAKLAAIKEAIAKITGG